jgi:hypothetical protein
MKQYVNIISCCFAVLVFGACTKTISDDTVNPFTGPTTPDDSVVVSYRNLEGLHQNIFAVKCANPTCHDGSFEPDFRTIQSTYASLIYHPVSKNDDLDTYKYRVWPGEVDSSWLYRRIVADEVLGRMPLYAEPLSTVEVEGIRAWIAAGAKDIFNNTANKPNLAPLVAGFVLFDANFNRIDTLRDDGFASTLLVKSGTDGQLAVGVEDAESDLADFNSAKVTFSYARDQWVSFQTTNLTKLVEDAMVTPFSANTFMQDTTIYFRVEVEDEQGAQTIFPNVNSPFYWKENFSFKVAP